MRFTKAVSHALIEEQAAWALFSLAQRVVKAKVELGLDHSRESAQLADLVTLCDQKMRATERAIVYACIDCQGC